MRKVGFIVHADPGFFGLEDLRRWGGNAAILKEGERLAGMSYYTLGSEVEIVDAEPTLQVHVALGEGAKKSESLGNCCGLRHVCPPRLSGTTQS